MVRRYVAIPVTWIQCAMLSSTPSSMLRPPMMALTIHAVLLAATAGVLFQRALATGEEPGSHHDRHGTPLTRDVPKHVEEVYVRLGHPGSLRRCLKGATQNANKRMHSKVWGRSIRRQASLAFSVTWQQHELRLQSSIKVSSHSSVISATLP